MTLRGARVARSGRSAIRTDIALRGGLIHSMASEPTRTSIDASGYLCLPGLINAHDHLEFNLFPRLGKGPHPNAVSWADRIYRPNESPVLEHRSVPKNVRLTWGALKNLVSGVTTVCHHNPPHPALFRPRFPVSVVRDFGWAHSMSYSPDIAEAWKATPKSSPFIIHAAESSDGSGASELSHLETLRILTSRLVIVHGVDLEPLHWRRLRNRGAACIACPSSNLFTLGRTLQTSAFRTGVPIALATDSALSASGDLLDELRLARRIWNLSPSRLFDMVTSIPAAILRLKGGEGELREGGAADIVVIRDSGQSPAEALLQTRQIDLVIRRGRIRLVSARFAKRLPQSLIQGFSPLQLAGRGRMLVDANIGALVRGALEFLPAPLRLAGRTVAV